MRDWNWKARRFCGEAQQNKQKLSGAMIIATEPAICKFRPCAPSHLNDR